MRKLVVMIAAIAALAIPMSAQAGEVHESHVLWNLQATVCIDGDCTGTTASGTTLESLFEALFNLFEGIAH